MTSSKFASRQPLLVHCYMV